MKHIMKKSILTFALFSFTFLLSGQGNFETGDTGNQGAGGNKKLDDGLTLEKGNQGAGGNRKLDLTLSLDIDKGNQGAGGNKKID